MANDIGFDFDIRNIDRNRSSNDGGAWVTGSTAGHDFQALVFPGHADLPEWELGRSRISKLWVSRRSDRTITFNFDRGADLDARDEITAEIVSFLAKGLARLIFGS